MAISATLTVLIVVCVTIEQALASVSKGVGATIVDRFRLRATAIILIIQRLSLAIKLKNYRYVVLLMYKKFGYVIHFLVDLLTFILTLGICKVAVTSSSLLLLSSYC